MNSILSQLPSHISGFWIPREDRFQGEYIAPYDERLAHVSGFTGSAGLGIITHDQKALFVDGRYTLQAKLESNWPIYPLTQQAIADFLKESSTPIGFDPWLMTETTYHKWSAYIVSVEKNPIDTIWLRPVPQPFEVIHHPEAFTGATPQERITHWPLWNNQGEAYVLCDPSALSWLTCTRAHIVPYTPVVLGFAVIWKGNVFVFADAIDPTEKLTIKSENELAPFLKSLPDSVTVHYDPNQTPYAIAAILQKKQRTPNPYLKPKACKNNIEQAGMKDCHIRDGVALTSFLAEIDQVKRKNQPLTEIEAAEKLLNWRKKQAHFHYPSFESISSAGANGAIVHYRPKGCTALHGLYLIDSGGQYNDGTTDVTRTIAWDTPTAEQKQRYTDVLKGHIALARSVFPKGTTGHQLDVLARQYLWQNGLDYEHGTGHGVGSFLSVHEGPQNISKRNIPVALEPGMIVSNEPGFYKTGEYGIRLESLVLVIDSQKDGFLEFETLTLAPFDLNLIDMSRLSDGERLWLFSYHKRAILELGPLLDAWVQEWLSQTYNEDGLKYKD